MNILKRGALPLFLVIMVSAVSVYFYTSDKVALAASLSAQSQKTVIIDAGHPALKNTKNTIDFKINKASPKKMHK